MIIIAFTEEYPEGRYIEVPDEEETEEEQSDG